MKPSTWVVYYTYHNGKKAKYSNTSITVLACLAYLFITMFISKGVLLSLPVLLAVYYVSPTTWCDKNTCIQIGSKRELNRLLKNGQIK